MFQQFLCLQLVKNSVVLLEQIRTLDKRRLLERIGELSPSAMKRVNTALLISLGFGDNINSKSHGSELAAAFAMIIEGLSPSRIITNKTPFQVLPRLVSSVSARAFSFLSS